jgi:chemotaxis protein MotB
MFEIGDAAIQKNAEKWLSTFTETLKKAEIKELRIEGHSDNVPIRKSSTAAQHPTNIHLSAHRSISVRDALANDGVDANRFMVAGYGEFRPIASNSARGNEMNRRVELYLVPMPAVEAVSTRSANPAPSSAKTVNATEEGENLK